MGGQQYIPAPSNSTANLFHGEAVWQFTGAAYLDTIIENERLDRILDEVIPVDQRVDQQLLEHGFGDFWATCLIERTRALDTGVPAFQEFENPKTKISTSLLGKIQSRTRGALTSRAGPK